VHKKVEDLLDEDLAWTETQPPPPAEEAMGGVFGSDEARTVSAGVGADRED
jgi:hypothetical protein